MYKCNAVSLNCCLSICPPIRFNGAFARAARLVDALYSCICPFELDVICLQELIAFRDTILNNFIHHTYRTHKIVSSLFGNNIKLVQSGLAIVSKWPILEEDAYIFEGKTYNAESFMAKAIQYCKLLLPNNQIVHVFNTHLQAWTNPKASAIRYEQMKQAAIFMDKKLSCVSPLEQVLFMGDINVDVYENNDIITKLMNEAGLYMITPDTPQFSFDPSKNQLVGTDDATEYATKSKINGCYDEYLRTGICSCCPKQLIDCVALRESQRDLLISSSMKVVPVLARAPFDIMVNMNTRRTISTVSDHFAVYAQLQFKVQKCGVKFKVLRKNMYRPRADLKWILIECIIFVSLLLLFFQACIWFKKVLTRLRKKKLA